MELLKQFIRKIAVALRLDLTRNLKYDRLTKLIMRKNLKPTSNGIDIGCHKGEIMDLILKYAPDGHHIGVEPIPVYYEKLVQKYQSTKNVSIHPFALSDTTGQAHFNFVKNAPAYSGLRKRKYAVKDPDIEEIEVELNRLDAICPSSLEVDFIKIDVEGGEFNVLKGAKAILQRCNPIILFEFGKGASEFYDTKPRDLFHFFSQLGYSIFTLKDFTGSKQAIDERRFNHLFESNKEYYFVAFK